MQIVGLDIGGANLKAANGDGQAASRSFAIWRHPEQLAAELHRLLLALPAADGFAVTMTAELADCFETKAEGVAAVLSAIVEVAGNRPVIAWQTGGEFVEAEVAPEIPLLVSAANWHALATFTGRLAPDGAALLLDIGTTTTDIIPLLDGVPIPRGLTDLQRLQSGELVYSGVSRTPVCAVVPEVTYDGHPCGVAAEAFATTADVYLLTGDRPEDSSDHDTPDGRSSTRHRAAARLARMLCCDSSELSVEDLEQIADEIAAAQGQRIGDALQRVLARSTAPCQRFLISGSGCFLAHRLLENHPVLSKIDRVDLSKCFSGAVATAACAYAVARLAGERATHLLSR
ncbi:MAG: hydantoinase/oxoprolinase family protein [Planctomycetaceae bacterium]|nr:hydantoinase/oxoprolinase family protein [Planctomycetaceae bacterium]